MVEQVAVAAAYRCVVGLCVANRENLSALSGIVITITIIIIVVAVALTSPPLASSFELDLTRRARYS